MNRREKILAVAVGLFVGLFVIYMLVNSLVLSDRRVSSTSPPIPEA